MQLQDKVFSFLRNRPGKEFTAREIAEWIFDTYPDECEEKRRRSKAVKEPLDTDAKLVSQISHEIGARYADGTLQKKSNKIKAIGNPRKYYFSPYTDSEEIEKAENNENASVSQKGYSSVPLREQDLYPILSKCLDRYFEERKLREQDLYSIQSKDIDKYIKERFGVSGSHIDNKVVVEDQSIQKIFFIPSRESILIQDFNISGGMIYVGHLGKQPNGNTPKSCINLDAEIATSNEDVQGRFMGYWPSYSVIPPKCRLAYLSWLKGGRRDKKYNIGYVFLFFYGLERRIFKDQSVADFEAIYQEVKELRQVYAHSRSFDLYSRCFLDTAPLMLYCLLSEDQKHQAQKFLQYTPLTEEARRHYNIIPLLLRIAIGKQIDEFKCIKDADLVFDWWLTSPEYSLTVSQKRVFSKLRELFKTSFEEQYPDGFQFSSPKKSINYTYKPASGDFSSTYLPTGLPDIQSIKAPLDEINELIQTCAEKLMPYGLVKKDITSLEEEKPFRMLKKELAKGTHLSSKAYVNTFHILSLCVAVAHADGHVSQEEKDYLMSIQEREAASLSVHEQNLLKEHLKWLLLHPPSWSAIRERISTLSNNEKSFLLKLLWNIACADGRVDKGEICFMEKLYKSMGLDESEIHSHIHSLENTKSDEPITIRIKESEKNYAIPPRFTSEGKNTTEISFRLDKQRIQDLEEEDAEVNPILEKIFANNEEEEIVTNSKKNDLDNDHCQLLEKLKFQDKWSCEDFEKLCQESNLMKDGAIEKINKWSDEQFGDCIIDEYEGQIFVDSEPIGENTLWKK